MRKCFVCNGKPKSYCGYCLSRSKINRKRIIRAVNKNPSRIIVGKELKKYLGET